MAGGPLRYYVMTRTKRLRDFFIGNSEVCIERCKYCGLVKRVEGVTRAATSPFPLPLSLSLFTYSSFFLDTLFFNDFFGLCRVFFLCPTHPCRDTILSLSISTRWLFSFSFSFSDVVSSSAASTTIDRRVVVVLVIVIVIVLVYIFQLKLPLSLFFILFYFILFFFLCLSSWRPGGNCLVKITTTSFEATFLAFSDQKDVSGKNEGKYIHIHLHIYLYKFKYKRESI